MIVNLFIADAAFRNQIVLTSDNLDLYAGIW